MHDATITTVFLTTMLVGVLPDRADGQVASPPINTAASEPFRLALEGGFLADDAPATGTDPVTDADALRGPSGDARFQLDLDVYLWLTGFSGTTGVDGVETEIDETFFDIVGESDAVFGLMGSVELTYDRFFAQLNGVYTYAEITQQSGTVREGIGGIVLNESVDLELEVRTAWIELLGGYRFIDHSFEDSGTVPVRLALDGYAGARFTDIRLDADVLSRTTLTLPGGRVLTANETASIPLDEQWVEPIVGGRLGMQIGDGWTLIVRGDVGGFGVGDSEFSWQAIAIAGYTWRLDGWDLSLFGGYRALAQDYDDGTFVWDVVTHGPILGLQFGFRF